MPRAIRIQRKQEEDDYLIPVVVAIFAMMMLAAYLVASFLAGAVDIGAPTDVSQFWPR